MAEPGTNTRPSSWGPPLTNDWWTKAADALLGRLIGYPAGEGPPPEQRDRLAQGVQIIFGAPESDDLGERAVRQFLKSDDPSDRLYMKLCDALVARCGPVIRREVAQTKSADNTKPTSPSAAVSSAPGQKSSARAPQGGSTIIRPTPEKPGEKRDWWQSYIDKQQADFDKEYENRLIIYQTCMHALDGPSADKFSKIPAVQLDRDQWKALFNRALEISRLAIGAPEADGDDAYHFDASFKVPSGLQSYWLLGELVHAQWQFEYMNAEVYNDILSEYLFSEGATEKSTDPIRGDLIDYRTIDKDPEGTDQFGAAQWAFGNWRPDLIDFRKNEIFEIKPLRTAHYGILQLWRYMHNYNCALYFDWLTKPGAQGKDMPTPLRLGRVRGDYFRPVDPSTFLEEYFRARDQRNQSSSDQKIRIPKSRQRARRSEVEGVLRAGGKIKVQPWVTANIPGLVLYVVHRDKKNTEGSVLAGIAEVALVITVLLVVTAMLVGVLYAAAIAEGGTLLAAAAEGEAGAVAASSAAELPAATGALVSSPTAMAPVGATVGAGSETMLETFSVSMNVKTAEIASQRTSTILTKLNARNVL